MQRSLLAFITGITALTITSSALAMTSIPSGWYLEGNVGTSRLSDKSYPAGSSSNTPGVGANLNLGYKFMPYMGLELGYTRYPDVVIKDSLGDKAAQDKHYAVDLAVKGILPIADSGFEAFAKLGIQSLNSNVTITDQPSANFAGITASNRTSRGLFMGIGGQYYFMPELAVVAQWQRAKGSNITGTMDLFSIGASFIFD